jgi:hypothetical protein
MTRAFFIPGVFFLLAAFILSLLTSISLPFLPALDITRTHFGHGAVQSNQQPMSELRVRHLFCHRTPREVDLSFYSRL